MGVMKNLVYVVLVGSLLMAGPSDKAFAEDTEKRKPSCDISKTTVCTIEIWLAHKQKKKNKDIRAYLKSKSIKVLRHTIQYWKPKGGHPPTNIAIGRGISAEDARLVIDFALKYNDRIDGLILAQLNPPNYVAIATSAWDDLSEVPVTPEQLEALRHPKLTTEEFHKLYYDLTGDKDLKKALRY